MGWSVPLPVFVNTVSLEHSHPIHLHILCGCFCSTKAELSCCDRDYMTRTTENTCCLALCRKSLSAPVLVYGSLRGRCPKWPLSGKTRQSQRAHESTVSRDRWNEGKKEEEPAVVPVAFYSFEFFPWSSPHCILSSLVGKGQIHPLASYCYSHIFGEWRWNPVWYVCTTLCWTWPQWSVRDVLCGDSCAEVIVLSENKQNGRHTWAGASSAATIWPESPNKEPHLGSHLPCLADS